MQTRESKRENNSAHVANLIRNNKLTELRAWFATQKNELDGRWDYQTDENFIEDAASDAILAGHEEMVKFLLNVGVSPMAFAYAEHPSEDDYYSQKHSLLHFAVRSGKLNMVKLLLENCEMTDSEPLWLAVKKGSADIVDYLLEKGADANSLVPEQSFDWERGNLSLLAKAVQDGNIPIVESLVKHGADPRTTSKYQYTPLSILVNEYRSNDQDALMHQMIDLLITHGADVNAPDHKNSTPLFIAVRNNNLAAIKDLLDHKAKINCQNVHLETPLHWAVRQGKIETVKLLLERGADYTLTNKDGLPPFLLASDPAIRKLMRDFAAKREMETLNNIELGAKPMRGYRCVSEGMMTKITDCLAYVGLYRRSEAQSSECSIRDAKINKPKH